MISLESITDFIETLWDDIWRCLTNPFGEEKDKSMSALSDKVSKLLLDVNLTLNELGVRVWLCRCYGRMTDRMTEGDVNILKLEFYELASHDGFCQRKGVRQTAMP